MQKNLVNRIVLLGTLGKTRDILSTLAGGLINDSIRGLEVPTSVQLSSKGQMNEMPLTSNNGGSLIAEGDLKSVGLVDRLKD